MIVKAVSAFLCQHFDVLCSVSQKENMSVKIGPALIDTGAWYTDAVVAVVVIFALGATVRFLGSRN